MRKILLIGGLLLLLLGGFFTWRALHPPLTDEQQIAAALDGITSAANNRQPRGVANYLAKDFKFGSTRKKEFQQSLAAGILQYRVVDLKLAGVQVDVNGETATSSGRYTLNLKSEYTSPAEVFPGNFDLKWRKIDGEWLVTEVEGTTVPGVVGLP